MTTIDDVTIIPTRPGRGEIWFSIDLAYVKDLTALFNLVGELGFNNPVLTHRRQEGLWEDHLLLHYERRETLESPPDELFEHEQYALADAEDILDPDGIRFTCGLTSPAVPV
jgi:hypothetical protein